MKFLHTADWQIGMRAAHIGGAGAKVREERLAAAQRLIRIAEEQGAQFILLAGDTFEDNGVSRILVQQIADILGSFSRTVYLIPGNHDPLVSGSVWDHPAWASHQNIRILKKAEPVAVDGGTLWPCPLFDKYGRSDPTSCIDPVRKPEHGIRIGIAHGTIEGLSPDEMYYPLPRDAATKRAVDYLALGHWHSFATFQQSNSNSIMAYSGSHESTKFGERDSGSAILVEIDAPGTVPKLQQLQTGRLKWEQWHEEIANEGQLAMLIKRLEQLNKPDATLLDLTLSGVMTSSDQPHLQRLREIIEARLFYSRIDDQALRPSPKDSSWLSNLPPGATRQAAERLQAWSDPAYPGNDRPEGTTYITASKALMELFLLTAEGGTAQ